MLTGNQPAACIVHFEKTDHILQLYGLRIQFLCCSTSTSYEAPAFIRKCLAVLSPAIAAAIAAFNDHITLLQSRNRDREENEPLRLDQPC
jgi:hypothetical protein